MRPAAASPLSTFAQRRERQIDLRPQTGSRKYPRIQCAHCARYRSRFEQSPGQDGCSTHRRPLVPQWFHVLDLAGKNQLQPRLRRKYPACSSLLSSYRSMASPDSQFATGRNYWYPSRASCRCRARSAVLVYALQSVSSSTHPTRSVVSPAPTSWDNFLSRTHSHSAWCKEILLYGYSCAIASHPAGFAVHAHIYPPHAPKTTGAASGSIRGLDPPGICWSQLG